MRTIPFSKVDREIKKHDQAIQKYKADLKQKLQLLVNKGSLKGPDIMYVKELLKVANNIITAKPATLATYEKKFRRIISPETMKTKAKQKFRTLLINTLGYSERRKDFYPHYFKDIGIGACIYCNSMLTVTVEKIIRKKRKTGAQARFQVDHYLPKSEYPCFSISLYNLYPTCASCNNSKGSHKVQFQLYAEDARIKNSGFYFELNMVSVGVYLLYRDSGLIDFEFIEPKIAGKNVKSFNEVFAVEGIYKTQKGIAEELILKAEVYTPAYKKLLAGSFPKIFTSASITDRLIIGNYTSESDLHKRPMAKFMIDIAIQLGLI
ncbi:MAG: hypothetical protein NTW29_10560 [Bacteroidetes bacterium]|nr:hypothetical protein [Bacteroidota bacterium]